LADGVVYGFFGGSFVALFMPLNVQLFGPHSRRR
jgi:hypothetical protein